MYCEEEGGMVDIGGGDCWLELSGNTECEGIPWADGGKPELGAASPLD